MNEKLVHMDTLADAKRNGCLEDWASWNCNRMFARLVAVVLPFLGMVMLVRIPYGNGRMPCFVAQRVKMGNARMGTTLVSHTPTEANRENNRDEFFLATQVNPKEIEKAGSWRTEWFIPDRL